MNRHAMPVRLLLLAIAASASAARATDTEQLRFQRPIAIQPRADDELVAVRLDAPIQAATADGYPDLRILDAEGREVSRVIRRASAVTMGIARTSFVVEAPRLKPLAGGGLEIEFTIDREKHPDAIDGFRIDTPLHNFEQSVRVERLDEGDGWMPVGEETLLYDYAQFMDTRQLEMPLPKERRRSPGGTWRITVAETSVEQQSCLTELVRTLAKGEEVQRREKVMLVRQPFRIDRIVAWHEEMVATIRGADRVDHPVAGIQVTNQNDATGNLTTISVPGGRVPTTALRLSVADRNFGRTARVQEPARGRSRGREYGTARIHHLDLRGIRREALAIEFPESRSAAYEIVIDNGDDQPLEVTGVTAVGPEYDAVFLARPGQSYRLAYGGDAVDGRAFPAPRYDTTAIDTALALGQEPTAATLGPIEERRVEPEEQPFAARILGSPRFIGITIAVLAVILTWSLIGAARRLGPPDEPSSGG